MKRRISTANIDADLISNLPDSLLIHIVSLLPAADANRTRILSKRWNNIWPLLPNLQFVTPKSRSTEEVNRFRHSVDQTLAVRGGMPFQRLLFDCHYKFDAHPIYDCLRRLLRCKSQELELRFPINRYLRVRVMFSLDLLKSCSSLVSLTLRGVMVFDIPDAELLFPCLKKMLLDSVTYSDVKGFANLISGSPVLEELVFEKYHIRLVDHKKDNSAMVASSPLKRLSFGESDSCYGYKVLIDAPKIEYLNIQDWVDTEYYFMTKPLSVTEAHIEIHPGAKSVAELVTCISCVKILTLGASTILALGNVDGLNLPVFPNLVKFVVGIDVDGSWIMLPSLLNNMPNLERITFADGLKPCKRRFTMRWHPRQEVPACLQFKMKEIIIKNQKTITPQEFGLIRYLLKHSKKLETLTMTAHEIDESRREQVLNFRRGSKSCRVEFV